jgi:geranylgeranyl diphosphate synthase type I
MTPVFARDPDTVIIGAGPAGSEMAYRLALAGFNVMVIEKEKPYREKPCGGGIQIKELLEFGALPEHVIERRIIQGRIISPDNRIVSVGRDRTNEFSVTVKRSIYDRYLQERAIQAGAELQSETKVIDIQRKNRQMIIVLMGKERQTIVRTRLLINAAGSGTAKLTKMMGIKDPAGEICLTYHHWLRPTRIDKNLEDSIEIYYLRENPEGYVWIFPKKDVISVGIGATADSIRKNKIHLKKLLTDFIENHPLASRKLKDSQIVRTDGGIIKFGILPKLWAPSSIVLGDAAGLANIVHGGGIYHARKSALIASKHCREFLRTGDQSCLEQYDQQARQFFENYEMHWDRKIRRILWNYKTIEQVIDKANKDEGIKEAIRIILNSTRPHEVAYKILEKKMLEIIYSELDKHSYPYKSIINNKLKGVFRKKTALHGYANEILLNDKAKRLRAGLGLLAAELFHGNKRDAVSFSLVYELFHTASLIHDDIMDLSEKRRGKKTLHIKYGLSPAIITGDLMLARGYSLVSQGAESEFISKEQLLTLLRVVGETGEACCLGQLQDIQLARKKQYGSINNYLKMVELKTGSLIEGAVKAGAVGAGASPEQVANIGRFGKDLGVAFQIIDDSLDLLGGAGAQKSMMNDMKQGKATPMIIYALNKANKEEKEKILRATGNPAVTRAMVKEILDIYRKYKAIAYAQELSLHYVERAQKELAQLPSGSASNKLNDILDVLGLWGMLGRA